jgi:hypothetical protein
MISGLAKVKSKEQRPSVKIDLSMFADGEECFVELSEPTAAALFPDAGFIQNLKIKYPDYPDSMLYQIALMGKCYVVQDNDPETFNAVQDFASLAKTNKECFYHILTEFLNAYPTDNIDDKVKKAKND